MEISLDLREAVRTQHEIDLETLIRCYRSLRRLERHLEPAAETEEPDDGEDSGLADLCAELDDAADGVQEVIKSLVQSVTYHCNK